MKPRKFIFPLIATLVAFAWSGWEQFTHEMTPRQKRGWFIAVSLVILLALVWLLWPYAKNLI